MNHRHRPARRPAVATITAAIATIAAAGFAASASAADPAPRSAPPDSEVDCVAIADSLESNQFVSFAGEVDDAAVQTDGPLTVFVPTDEAMTEIPPNVFAALAADPSLATALVDYHVVVGEQLSLADLVDAGEVTTSADPLTVTETDAGVTVGEATIVCPDITFDDDVDDELTIHVIDTVLQPPAIDSGAPGSSVPGSSVPGSSVPGGSVPGNSEAPMFDENQEAAATAWETVVDSSLSFDEQAPYLEDSEALQAMAEAYPAAADVVGGISAEVIDVVIDGGEATLQYRLFFAGVDAGYPPQEAIVIDVDGEWVVSVEQYCEFQALARNPEPCPV